MLLLIELLFVLMSFMLTSHATSAGMLLPIELLLAAMLATFVDSCNEPNHATRASMLMIDFLLERLLAMLTKPYDQVGL
ncbi:hypothetical protein PF005_g4093 [Phytophthora fragariae]|uniref:Secreted protein n=1 Tax=Phytophthora fragariae TaxID=53985 RepID=A0A6A3FN22_9STRA|nr:hypothetical protein PF003_g20779 [Phytophthora fragariae]KAE8945741.1 hypothetical protein PF009_g4595 [Phytophthora fragariae]KAE9105591.1 hypothetical protein PF010_g12955 [Phytophthora fragariae]KAE9131558.1 hypothetical protein PF007_g4081 [Phytophthora fragariae]KAE9142577.1 hypothetical protein PF006_g12326 [Phytophthora fragariae]